MWNNYIISAISLGSRTPGGTFPSKTSRFLETFCACAKLEDLIMLYDGSIVWRGTQEELKTSTDPYAKQFINGSIEGPMIAAVH